MRLWSSRAFQNALRVDYSKDLARQASETALGGCVSLTPLKIPSASRARWGMVVVLVEACGDRLSCFDSWIVAVHRGEPYQTHLFFECAARSKETAVTVNCMRERSSILIVPPSIRRAPPTRMP